MENENYPIGKHALYYGLFTGLGLILVSLIFYILDFYGEKWTSYVSYIVLLLGIILLSIPIPVSVIEILIKCPARLSK